MSSQHRSPVDVLAVLVRNRREVLLTLRAGGIYGAGEWALPSGSVEADEDVISAVRRELAEELGIDVSAEDVRCFTVAHARPPGGDARIGFGMVIERWAGELEIREPDKCAELAWWPVGSDLPSPVMAYTLEMLHLYQSGVPFSVCGWERPAGSEADLAPPARGVTDGRGAGESHTPPPR